MKYLIISIAIGIMTCHFTSAQDLNGVKINAVMNCEQVISKFGEPSKYAERDSGDLGVDKYYYYGESYLHFNDDKLVGFCLRDPAFLALTADVDGGLKIGDSLSRLDDFKYGKPQKYRDQYILYWNSDCPVYLIVENGIIIGIDYNDPV